MIRLFNRKNKLVVARRAVCGERFELGKGYLP